MRKYFCLWCGRGQFTEDVLREHVCDKIPGNTFDTFKPKAKLSEEQLAIVLKKGIAR